MKVKFLQVQNLLVSLKAIATSILTGAIMIIPLAIGMWLVRNNFMFPGRLIQLVSLIGYLFVWGFLARKLWRWS
jgi:hypothetical protein